MGRKELVVLGRFRSYLVNFLVVLCYFILPKVAKNNYNFGVPSHC